ncbi:hypothetical protein KR067_011247 [Drosophila pandora]|nr:hypothetical protein KR067_011247 [Drosophila pandora]
MGVTGLWKLIEPCGKPVPVETLEGKILAVDISIWLHQVVKGFQDSKGSALNNAHLLGLFHRLCKLLYYRVRPVFIFDGCVPQLKRDTIARRQQQRNKLSNEADRIQALLLQSLAKEKVVQQALGKNAELLLKSPAKRPPPGKSKDNEDDMFKLPELPAAAAGTENPDESDQDMDCTSASATSDSSFDESNARHAYQSSLQAIDVKSQHFRNLPADVRHEILTDIKETRKQSSWGRLHELPARSDDFCSFQMKRLLKRRAVQESLEQAEQEMGGRTLTYSELCDFFSEEGIVTPSAIEQSTRQISSDEHTRFLLVRDLKKKALESVKEEVKIEKIEVEEKPSTSTAAKSEEHIELGTEYDEDLAKALAMSMEETKVYDEKDYEYDSDQELRLNRAQSKQLKHAAKGPARAYMIEYGGMNDEEVGNIMEATQLNDTQSLEMLFETSTVPADTANDSIEEAKLISRAIEESRQISQAIKESQGEDKVEIIHSDTDSDLEEVGKVKGSNKNEAALEIQIDITKDLQPSSDLFADIFEKEGAVSVNQISSDEDDDDFIEVSESENEKLSQDVKNGLEVDSGSTVSKDKVKIQASSDEIVEVKDSQEMELITDSKAKKEDEIVEIKDSQELEPIEEKENPTSLKTKPDLDSILNQLKKETAAVKNITLNLNEEADPKPKVALGSILDDLRAEMAEVKNIKLEQVKLNNSTTIELSSDDEVVATKNKSIQNEEVIELCDSDDNKKARISPNKTPSKNKSIKDFFETSYVVKRTPDKSPAADATPPGTPKVPQPFYRKRTPKSGRKRAAEDEEDSDEGVSPTKRSSKASKSLFESKEPEVEKTVDPQELINDAAEALKSQKTSEELQEMATNLAQERKELEIERNRQDRMGMSISQRMSIDCQELLRLFGIPYIVAPMEAEAQCAFLNATDLTHGTITDDSDIWLFGGRTVYKNFFAQNKHVLEFRSEQIEQTFNCNRGKLIQLACLVGSDYTTGIHGIGAVTALEILASFSGHDPSAQGVSNQSVLHTLIKFRDWWQAHKSSNLPPGSSARLALRKKLKNIELHEGFPNGAVVEAYLTPTVDDNKEAFSWGSPDVELIREFTRKSFGWTASKTDDILMPVIKKINDKKVQGSIRNYFTSKSALRVQQPQVSKRVQLAIDKMSGKIDEETPEKPKKVTRTRRAKAAPAPIDDDEAMEAQPSTSKRGKRKAPAATVNKEPNLEEPSTSQSAPKPEKCPRIPNTKEVIPQREKDLEQMRLNKAKAAEILKKSAKGKKN